MFFREFYISFLVFLTDKAVYARIVPKKCDGGCGDFVVDPDRPLEFRESQRSITPGVANSDFLLKIDCAPIGFRVASVKCKVRTISLVLLMAWWRPVRCVESSNCP